MTFVYWKLQDFICLSDTSDDKRVNPTGSQRLENTNESRKKKSFAELENAAGAGSEADCFDWNDWNGITSGEACEKRPTLQIYEWKWMFSSRQVHASDQCLPFQRCFWMSESDLNRFKVFCSTRILDYRSISITPTHLAFTWKLKSKRFQFYWCFIIFARIKLK